MRCCFLESRIGIPHAMQDKLTLMIPGPTPVPETVLKAMGRHPIGHRSGEFQTIVRRTTEQLKWLHQTSSDVLVITGSGTAAMEAGMINTLSRGDKVLCGDNGKFGERWVKVARAYGLEVDVVTAEWGQPLDTEAFRAALEADTEKQIKAVILTHSETSTGRYQRPRDHCSLRQSARDSPDDCGLRHQPWRLQRAHGCLGTGRGGLGIPEGVHASAGSQFCGDE
jgi:aspartate aminotransferase-like enzyme